MLPLLHAVCLKVPDFFLITYCCHFESGNLKVLEHKAHALRTFILKLRTFVDFVQRPWNLWEDGIALDLMEIICYSLDCIKLVSGHGPLVCIM